MISQVKSEIPNTKMSKGKKICFLVFPIIIFVVLNGMGILAFWQYKHGLQEFDSILGYIIFVAGIFHLVFTFVYIMHAITNQKLSKSEKWVWGILIYGFSVLAMVIYWFTYIKTEPTYDGK